MSRYVSRDSSREDKGPVSRRPCHDDNARQAVGGFPWNRMLKEE